MIERAGVSTFGPTAVTLLGPELRVGDRAPDFDLLGTDGTPIRLETSAGRTRIVLSILSVDTNVCHAEMKEISRRVARMDGVEVVVVSTDLPFAMRRWREESGVENVTLASDHREASFGLAWGTLVKTNPVWDFLFVWSSYHMEHHYFPGVPCYNLAALHRELRPVFERHPMRRRTYTGLLYDWFVRNRTPHLNWH